jgi:hypothetical protein
MSDPLAILLSPNKTTKGKQMSKTFEDVWDEVAEGLDGAKAIAFDGCHKIYVLLDHAQVDLMLGYGYGNGEDDSRLIHAIGSSQSEMLETLKSWFNDSCSLRFIEGVETNEEDPNKGFTSLIPQGYEAEFCSVCGNFGADYDQLCEDCRDEA